MNEEAKSLAQEAKAYWMARGIKGSTLIARVARHVYNNGGPVDEALDIAEAECADVVRYDDATRTFIDVGA